MHQLFASGGQSIGVFLTLSVNTYGLGKQPVDAPLLFVENKKHSVTMSISDWIGREGDSHHRGGNSAANPVVTALPHLLY